MSSDSSLFRGARKTRYPVSVPLYVPYCSLPVFLILPSCNRKVGAASPVSIVMGLPTVTLQNKGSRLAGGSIRLHYALTLGFKFCFCESLPPPGFVFNFRWFGCPLYLVISLVKVKVIHA